MKKDSRRDSNLMSQQLKIPVLTVPNNELGTGVKILKKLSVEVTPMNSHRIRRMWITVHAYTVTNFYSIEQIGNYLKIDLKGLHDHMKRHFKEY